jgi:hypothetical protein
MDCKAGEEWEHMLSCFDTITISKSCWVSPLQTPQIEKSARDLYCTADAIIASMEAYDYHI